MGFNSRNCFDPLPYNDNLTRFDARYWSLDYPLTAIATIVSRGTDTFEVYSRHRSNQDLIGVIWDTEDRFGHESFAYEFDGNYSGNKVVFQSNFPDPFAVTVTVNDHVIRLFPYTVSGGNLIPMEPPAVGIAPNTVLPTYPLSITNGSYDPAFPYYIIDFDNLRSGYNMDGPVVNTTYIVQIFISIVSPEYGLGSGCMIETVGGFHQTYVGSYQINTTDTEWFTFKNATPGIRLKRGDVITVNIGVADADRTHVGKKGGSSSYLKSQTFDVHVTEIEYLNAARTRFRVKAQSLMENVAWMEGRASLKGAPQAKTPVGDIEINQVFKNIHVSGRRPVIGKRNYPDAPHDLHMSSGFDDTYNITPWRQIEQAWHLGYRGRWTSYMGMSHYYNAQGVLKDDKFAMELIRDVPLNEPTIKHMEDLFAHMSAKGYTFVWSTAYEILNSVIPEEWRQLNYKGEPALTGWVPPSSFIIPAKDECLDYLASVIIKGVDLMVAAGMRGLNFQVGEPWWWDGLYSDGAPCIYDPFSMALYKAETGKDVPTPFIKNSILDINAPENAKYVPYVNWLRAKLGRSTGYIRDKVKASHPSAKGTLLFFTPQIMNPASTFLTALNFPEPEWKYPNYDFIQIEDYDWIINGELDLVPLTFEAATTRLGYPIHLVDYFIGFVNYPTQTWVWPNMQKALELAHDHNINHITVWAYPQIIRDNIFYSASNIVKVEPMTPLHLRRQQVANVEDDVIEPLLYAEIGADIRLHSGVGIRSFQGQQWFGTGQLGHISKISENINLDNNGWDLKLIGIPAELHKEVSATRRGEPARVFLAMGNNTPKEVCKGFISRYTVEIGNGGNLTVACRLVSKLYEAKRSASARYTHYSQIEKYPDDIGLEFVADMKNLRIEWGK